MIPNSSYLDTVLKYVLINHFYKAKMKKKIYNRTIDPLKAKYLYDLANKYIENINKELIKIDFSFNAVYRDNEDETNTPPIKIFMRLMTGLHGKAKALKCDIPAPESLSLEERTGWEIDHYEILMRTVLVQMLAQSISQPQSKQKTMDHIVQEFTNSQLKKYAKEFDLQPWEDFKLYISSEDKFQREYNSKANFIQYLKDIKICGQSASDGIFTEDDIEKFAEVYRDAMVIEVVDD